MDIKANNLSMVRQGFAAKREDIAQNNIAEKNQLGRQLHQSQQQRMREMQESVAKLQELKKSNSPKKAARSKAAMLKQRLETLKKIMQKLPPGDYKVLAQEIKQIAKELAALSKQLGKSAAPNLALPQMAAGQFSQGEAVDSELADLAGEMVDVPPPAAVEPQVEQLAEAELSQVEAQELEQAATQAEAEAQASVSGTEENNPAGKLALARNSEQDEEDKQLRAVLAESKKLLKDVLSLLKAKHQSQDKDSRKIIAAIERDLERLDQALGSGNMELAADAAADITAGIDSNIGGFVDTSV